VTHSGRRFLTDSLSTGFQKTEAFLISFWLKLVRELLILNSLECKPAYSKTALHCKAPAPSSTVVSALLNLSLLLQAYEASSFLVKVQFEKGEAFGHTVGCQFGPPALCNGVRLLGIHLTPFEFGILLRSQRCNTFSSRWVSQNSGVEDV